MWARNFDITVDRVELYALLIGLLRVCVWEDKFDDHIADRIEAESRGMLDQLDVVSLPMYAEDLTDDELGDEPLIGDLLRALPEPSMSLDEAIDALGIRKSVPANFFSRPSTGSVTAVTA